MAEIKETKHCRVCLENQGVIPIFGDKNYPDISVEFTTFGTVDILIDDDFPKLLCRKCFTLLEGAVSFRKAATRSDVYLKERRKKLGKYNLSIPVKTEVDFVPPKIHEKWPHGIIDQDFLKRDDTDDQNYTLELKSEVLDNEGLETETVNITKTKSKVQYLKCKKCYQKFKSTDDLDHHEPSCTPKRNFAAGLIPIKRTDIKRRSRVKNRECEICNLNFTTNMYPKHMRQVHNIKANIPTKTKECPICKKMCRPDYVKIHIKTMHSQEKEIKKKVECPVCNKVFAHRYFKVHIKTHDQGKRDYICDICGKDFIFRCAFMKHKATHTNDLPFKCDQCPYRGRNKELLRIHTRTHTGDYPYKCDHCSARCVTKSNLNRHMQRHRDAVDFLCDSCNRGFYTKVELERHISAVHLGIKNHLCNVCGAAFGYKRGLRTHMRKVHKISGPQNALYLKLQTDGDLQQESTEQFIATFI